MMAAASGDEYRDLYTPSEQTAIKSFRLQPFDPSKPDTWKAYETAFTAAVSTSTAEAINMGTPPTLEQTREVMGPSASALEVADTHETMLSQWEAAQSEAYRVLSLSIEFRSPKGKTLLERIHRVYSQGRKGVECFNYLRRRYGSHLSFSKQQSLIDKLESQTLAASRSSSR